MSGKGDGKGSKSSAKNPIGGSSANNPIGGSSANNPIGGSSANNPIGGSSANNPIGGSSADHRSVFLPVGQERARATSCFGFFGSSLTSPVGQEIWTGGGSPSLNSILSLPRKGAMSVPLKWTAKRSVNMDPGQVEAKDIKSDDDWLKVQAYHKKTSKVFNQWRNQYKKQSEAPSVVSSTGKNRVSCTRAPSPLLGIYSMPYNHFMHLRAQDKPSSVETKADTPSSQEVSNLFHGQRYHNFTNFYQRKRSAQQSNTSFEVPSKRYFRYLVALQEVLGWSLTYKGSFSKEKYEELKNRWQSDCRECDGEHFLMEDMGLREFPSFEYCQDMLGTKLDSSNDASTKAVSISSGGSM